MPSTGWNVFVTSVVALVVYIAFEAEMVLLGIIAGTLTFVTGWLLGYAINQDLLDSMELSRLLVAGTVTVFAIVWTLLYTQQAYIRGLIVICLVWFAAWFTSSMGPIKGRTGAMETIDEPRPPAGTEPGEQLHLGGPEDQYNDGDDGGFLGGLLRFGSEASGGSANYATEPETPSDESETSRTQPTESTGITTSGESLFGLGIFYEEEPSSAGVEEDSPVVSATPRNQEPATQPQSEPSDGEGAPEATVDPPERRRELAASDHTRPSTTGTSSSNVDQSGRVGDESEEETPHSEPTGATNATTDGDTTSESDSRESDAETGEEDEPPEAHRVDVEEDDSGFIFG